MAEPLRYSSCSVIGVNLYDIELGGSRAPLTSQQISELFHAGRLGRHDPCKLVQSPTWRTVDEVFPLLKYGSFATGDDTAPSPTLVRQRNAFMLAAAITAAVCLAITYLLARQSSPSLTASLPVTKPIGVNRVSAQPAVLSTSNFAAPAQPAINQQSQPVRATVPQALTGNSFGDAQLKPTNAQVANYNAAMEMKRRGDQAAAEKAAAAQRWRADLEKRQADAEKREADAKRLAGTNYVIPLEKYVPITVGGSSVMVRIRDNNILTFDASVNGQVRRNIPKEKGISHTGADETLIYNNGRASLYYVWEISGTLNHCLLRVREQ